jgi:hypothetical protein
MNTSEEYYIYKTCQQGYHLNDLSSDTKSSMYGVIISLHENNPPPTPPDA